jgi:hypothetical protein
MWVQFSNLKRILPPTALWKRDTVPSGKKSSLLLNDTNLISFVLHLLHTHNLKNMRNMGRKLFCSEEETGDTLTLQYTEQNI